MGTNHRSDRAVKANYHPTLTRGWKRLDRKQINLFYIRHENPWCSIFMGRKCDCKPEIMTVKREGLRRPEETVKKMSKFLKFFIRSNGHE